MFSSEHTDNRGGDSLAAWSSSLFNFVDMREKEREGEIKSLVWRNSSASLWPYNQAHLGGDGGTKCAMFEREGKCCIWWTWVTCVIFKNLADILPAWVNTYKASTCLLSSTVPPPSLFVGNSFPHFFVYHQQLQLSGRASNHRRSTGLRLYSNSFIAMCLVFCSGCLNRSTSLVLTSVCLHRPKGFCPEKTSLDCGSSVLTSASGYNSSSCFWFQTWHEGLCSALHATLHVHVHL